MAGEEGVEAVGEPGAPWMWVDGGVIVVAVELRLLQKQEHEDDDGPFNPHRPPDLHRPPWLGSVQTQPPDRRPRQRPEQLAQRVPGKRLAALVQEEDVHDNARAQDAGAGAEGPAEPARNDEGDVVGGACHAGGPDAAGAGADGGPEDEGAAAEALGEGRPEEGAGGEAGGCGGDLVGCSLLAW